MKPEKFNPENLKPKDLKLSPRPSYLAPLIIGGALILFGILFLLNNFEIVKISAGSVFAGIFILAGLIFLIVFFLDHEQWWALIPGFVMMGVGATILVGEYVHLRGMDLGGAVMLIFIALPFWIIYILKRDYWWALFPAGALTSIALMTLIPDTAGDLAVAIMFFGWAGTFLLVYFLAQQKWAIWPSIGLLVFAVSFAVLWLLMRRPVFAALGWMLHILFDIFTHREMFAIQFLWPVSSFHVDGIRWETPWFLAATYATLVVAGLLLWGGRLARRVSVARPAGRG